MADLTPTPREMGIAHRVSIEVCAKLHIKEYQWFVEAFAAALAAYRDELTALKPRHRYSRTNEQLRDLYLKTDRKLEIEREKVRRLRAEIKRLGAFGATDPASAAKNTEHAEKSDAQPPDLSSRNTEQKG